MTVKRFVGWTDRDTAKKAYADLDTRFSSYNTKAEGLIADSVADDRAALDTLANVTMQPNGGQLDVVGVPRIGSNLTIPANVTLRFLNSAYLAPDVGVTVTMNAELVPTMRKVYGGGGAVVFGASWSAVDVIPQWWGALGDGVNNDYPAINSAQDAIPVTGGSIGLPITAVNKYYCASSLHLIKPIWLHGNGMAQPTTGPVGTVLEFAADKTGIYIEGYTTFGDTVIASRGYGGLQSTVGRLTIRSRGGTTGLLNGGTGVAVDAIRVRADGVYLHDLWIGTDTNGAGAGGWKRNGVRIWASSGSGDPTLAGSANLWSTNRVFVYGSGSDGVAVFGTDVNDGNAFGGNSSLNGGRGIGDDSFLGCNWWGVHASGNTSYGFQSTNVNAASLFAGCYLEGGGTSKFAANTFVVAGNLSGGGGLDTSGGGTVFGPHGILHGGSISHQNLKGAVAVAIELGHDTADRVVLRIASGDEAAGLDLGTDIVYSNATKWWFLQHLASGDRMFFGWPNGLAAARAFAPGFQNGLYVGGFADSGIHVTSGAAAPTTGFHVAGDIVLNINSTVAGQPLGWKCVTTGTPGAHVPFGMDFGFGADRGNASVTWVLGTDKFTQRFNTAITADRVFDLPAGSVANRGVRVRVVREAGATGAFNITVRDSGGATLKVLGAASTWCEVESDGATFRLTAAGAL